MTAEDFVGYDHGMEDRRGLWSLANVDDVGLVLCPDAMLAYSRMSVPEARAFVQRIQDSMIDLCEQTQDRFAILDLPDTRDIEEVRPPAPAPAIPTSPRFTSRGSSYPVPRAAR